MLILPSLVALDEAIDGGRVGVGDQVVVPESVAALMPDVERAALRERLRARGAHAAVTGIGEVILVVQDAAYACALSREGHARPF